MFDSGKIKTRKMIKFEPVGIGQNSPQIGSSIVAIRTKTDQMLVALTIRYLQQAQAVPVGLEPHCFCVHGNGPIRQRACGNIFLVKKNCHYYLPVYLIGGPTLFSQPLYRHDILRTAG